MKGFIVQGGDPEGNGNGGESIYGEPFKDEFHSRLRYTRRGLVGMANSGKNDNASQFFFTLAATPELQNANTLFGKVTGDTVFNMLKLEEGMVDQDERPMYPHKILKTVILSNPFDDIKPRVKEKSKDGGEKKKKKEKGVKNFGLLSFGDEAETEEQEAASFVQQNAGKSKSTHDVLDDPKLSKEVAVVEKSLVRSTTPELEGDAVVGTSTTEDTEQTKESIREKLKRKAKAEEEDSSDDDLYSLMNREKEEQKRHKADQIRKEISKLKRDYATEKKAQEKVVEEAVKSETAKSELVKDYLSEKDKYAEATKKIPKKGVTRESQTLQMLAKFKEKLRTAREAADPENKPTESPSVNVEDEIQGDNWLAHELNFENDAPVLAKDASTKGDDWYDVYDPRNPLNKRKRNEQSASASSSRSKRR